MGSIRRSKADTRGQHRRVPILVLVAAGLLTLLPACLGALLGIPLD